MGIFDFFKSQKIDVIRWENPSPEMLVWKWDKSLDEIKNNSSLIVDPGLAAIFVRNGKIEAIQTESGKWSLETGNTPFISTLKNFLSGFETHDKAAVYFIKTQKIASQKWGTPNPVTYSDPEYNFPVELRAFGNFTFQIIDVENFWTQYVANSGVVLTDDIRMIITDRIVGNIASIFAQKKVSYNEVDAHTMDIAKTLKEITAEEFSIFGFELVDFRIENINFTDKTNNFVDKITSKKADVGAINATAGIDASAMQNYKELENLNIMKDAANNSGTGSDAMGAGIGMAMGMNMAQVYQNTTNPNMTPNLPKEDHEAKLAKLKNLHEKGLISPEDYDTKKREILAKM